jgi:hypothetical protein
MGKQKLATRGCLRHVREVAQREVSVDRYALYFTTFGDFSGGAIENTNQVFQPEDRF